MSQYAALDSVILNALGNSSAPIPFNSLWSHPDVRRECDRLTELSGRDAWRVLDGRIAALRKAGKIQPASRKAGWELA